MTPQNRMIAKKRKNQVEGHRRGKTGKQKTEKKEKRNGEAEKQRSRENKTESRKTKKQISREPGKTEKQGSIKKMKIHYTKKNIK